jgi:hypothetical protein
VNWPGMSGDDFAAAMSETGDWDALGLAPVKLRWDRAMANHSASAPANEWPSDAGAIAYVQIYAAQRAAPIAESDDVGNIEQSDTICPDAISDGRRANGVFNRVRLKADAGDGNRFLQWHYSAVGNRPGGQRPPRARRRVDRAGGTVSETTRMVGMGVCQENGGRGDTREQVQPVAATIDHNPGLPACDDDAAVASVKS